MTKLIRYAGIAASLMLIAFGIGSIYMGLDGRDRVRGDLAKEQIVGTPDSSIPGQKVDTGPEAQAFAQTIRKHTLEATQGQTYSEMGRFLAASGKPVSDEAAAAKDPKTGRPVENPARDIWISSTAFQTALNTAYFAESVATFVAVVGAMMLLAGIGFLLMTLGLVAPATAAARSKSQAFAPTPAAG